MDDVLKQLHDEWLEKKPSGASHGPDSCPYCVADSDAEDPGGGGDMSKTYTEDELTAAVADATKPLIDKIEELQASHEQTEMEARFAKEREGWETEKKELQASLDKAVLEASEAGKRHDEIVEFLDKTKAEAEAAAELSARREARIAKVKEVASFPDEYVEQSADRWAAMSEEDFAAMTADWQTIASKKDDSENTSTVPDATAMVASRNGGSTENVLRDVMRWTVEGIDPRTL